PPKSTPFPYTTLFRSGQGWASPASVEIIFIDQGDVDDVFATVCQLKTGCPQTVGIGARTVIFSVVEFKCEGGAPVIASDCAGLTDRKITRLNSSHVKI